jgi:hypothetical protein
MRWRTSCTERGEFVRILQGAGELLRGTRRLFNRTSLLFRVLALVSLGLIVVFSGFVVLGMHWVNDSQSRTRTNAGHAELTAQTLYDRLSRWQPRRSRRQTSPRMAVKTEQTRLY